MTAKFQKPVEGSRKRKVFDAFQQQGRDEAFKLGKRLRLAESSVRTWLGTWTRNGVKPRRKSTLKLEAA